MFRERRQSRDGLQRFGAFAQEDLASYTSHVTRECWMRAVAIPFFPLSGDFLAFLISRVMSRGDYLVSRNWGPGTYAR